MEQKITDLPVFQGYIRLCEDGWQMGWHERNGGNFTYRLTADETEACRPFFREKPGEWTDLKIEARNLAGEYFISTGSGRFLRNVALAPEDNICLAEIDESGRQYRIVWGLEKGGVPTSEFPSHLLNHSVKKDTTRGQYRVIYHAHPPALIALTFLLPLTSRDFTRALWQSMTECPIVFPAGVGVVPWMVPGGPEIARVTSELMKQFDAVVWAHHGLFCAGESFDSTFGLMHTIEKSADICLKVISSGQPVQQTITDDNLRQLALAFGVSLNEDFLH